MQTSFSRLVCTWSGACFCAGKPTTLVIVFLNLFSQICHNIISRIKGFAEVNNMSSLMTKNELKGISHSCNHEPVSCTWEKRVSNLQLVHWKNRISFFHSIPGTGSTGLKQKLYSQSKRLVAAVLVQTRKHINESDFINNRVYKLRERISRAHAARNNSLANCQPDCLGEWAKYFRGRSSLKAAKVFSFILAHLVSKRVCSLSLW